MARRRRYGKRGRGGRFKRRFFRYWGRRFSRRFKRSYNRAFRPSRIYPRPKTQTWGLIRSIRQRPELKRRYFNETTWPTTNPAGLGYAITNMFNTSLTQFSSSTTGVQIRAGGIALSFIPQIPNGTAYDQKVGNQIIVKGIEFRAKWSWANVGTPPGASWNINYHINIDWVLYNGEVTYSSGTSSFTMQNYWADLYGYNDGSRMAEGIDTREPNTMRAWRLLKRYKLTMMPSLPRNATGGTIPYADPCIIKNLSLKFKKGLRIDWDAGHAQPSPYTNRTLFCIIYSNVPNSLTDGICPKILSFSARVFFYDS